MQSRKWNQNQKLILKQMESQCKEAETGVMCSYLLVAVKSQAAEFCTACSCFQVFRLRQEKKLLQ